MVVDAPQVRLTTSTNAAYVLSNEGHLGLGAIVPELRQSPSKPMAVAFCTASWREETPSLR